MKFCPYCGTQLQQEYKFCPKCGQNISVFNTQDESSFAKKDGFSVACEAIKKPLEIKPLSKLSTFGSMYINDFTDNDFSIVNGLLECYISFLAEAKRQNPKEGHFDDFINEANDCYSKFSDNVQQFKERHTYPAPFNNFFKQNQAYINNLIKALKDENSTEYKKVIMLLTDALGCMTIVEKGEYNHELLYILLGKMPATNEKQNEECSKPVKMSQPQPYIAQDFKEDIESIERNLKEQPPLKISYYDPSIDYWKELDGLIGLQSVKTQLRSIIDDYKLQVRRKEKHPDLNITTSMNFVFTGSPGTGKTTVARLVAGVLRQEGIIKGGMCVEVDASNLVSGWIGFSSSCTKLAALRAMDGILFIDEAYSIANNMQTSHGAGPGKDVIDTLTPIMENNRSRLGVILAGYEKEMSDFFKDSNTGFPSRFKSTIKFEDYTPTEMITIFQDIAKTNKYIIPQNALRPIEMIFELIYKQRGNIPSFANARTVRSIFEKVKERASRRMKNNPNVDLDKLSIEDMKLSNEEIKQAIGLF